jgi:hypothetical protein
MRRCENCHDAAVSHRDWLPYIDKHMAALACESCHIPQMHAPAIQSYDWTVLDAGGQPVATAAASPARPRHPFAGDRLPAGAAAAHATATARRCWRPTT